MDAKQQRQTFPGLAEICSKDLIALATGLLGLAAAMAVFFWQVKLGLRLIDFPDETEKLVAAQMLLKGHHLYRDVYAAHGPVPYIVAHLYSVLFSSSDFSYIRLVQCILALLSTLALSSTPGLKTAAARMWAAAIYVSALSSVWTLLWLHMVLYQSISGFLFVILVTQLVLPLLLNKQPTKLGMVASGMSAALICFSAYSLAPAVLLFSLSALLFCVTSCSKDQMVRHLKYFAFGFLAITVVVVSWLYFFADLEGYLVYHIYSMQKFYASYIEYTPALVLKNFAFSFAPDTIVHSFALLSVAAFLYVFIARQPLGTWRSAGLTRVVAVLLFFAAVFMTNPRADFFFPDSSFVTISSALLGATGGLVLQDAALAPHYNGLWRFAVLVAVVVGLSFQLGAYASPNGIAHDVIGKYRMEMRPRTTGIYAFVRSIAKNDGDLLSLIYAPDVYIKAGRLPASGNYYYLPWQAAYNKHPIGGYRIDICGDITSRKPAIIWLFNWRVWGKYQIDDYEPCVLSLVYKDYAPISFDSPWYVRKDILTTLSFPPPQDAEEPEWVIHALRTSYPLASFSSIPLLMMESHKRVSVPLKRLGVLIKASNVKQSGEAEIQLVGEDGAVFAKRFDLTGLADNAYHFFNVTPARYVSGHLIYITGDGISTWESHLENGDVYSCLVYEYLDGSRRFTPACPLM